MQMKIYMLGCWQEWLFAKNCFWVIFFCVWEAKKWWTGCQYIGRKNGVKEEISGNIQFLISVQWIRGQQLSPVRNLRC